MGITFLDNTFNNKLHFFLLLFMYLMPVTKDKTYYQSKQETTLNFTWVEYMMKLLAFIFFKKNALFF